MSIILLERVYQDDALREFVLWKKSITHVLQSLAYEKFYDKFFSSDGVVYVMHEVKKRAQEKHLDVLTHRPVSYLVPNPRVCNDIPSSLESQFVPPVCSLLGAY